MAAGLQKQQFAPQQNTSVHPTICLDAPALTKSNNITKYYGSTQSANTSQCVTVFHSAPAA